MLVDDLNYEVGIRSKSKLLETHIKVRVHILKVFELLPCEEVVFFTLVFNFIFHIVIECS